MTKPPRELLEFLDRYEPGVRSLALSLRELVHREVAPCHEYIFEMRSKVVLLYGATERVIADGICQIAAFSRHVTLAFPRGAEFDDPAGALRGAGKGMRHIRLSQPSDVDRPELRPFLRQARSRAGVRRSRERKGVVTSVKKRPLR
jgi:hypothetical protein